MTLPLVTVVAAALLAWSRRGTPPPAVPAVPAFVGATFGPWAEHGPRCRCSPCR